MKDQILADIGRLIDQAMANRPNHPTSVFVDPFNPDNIINRPDLPEPAIGETRFYYYYHRTSGNMMLRYGTSTYEIEPDALNIKVPTYSLKHIDTHLKCMIAGNARRIEIHRGKTTLT